MQRATDNLRADHALTMSAVAVLRAIAREVRVGGPFPAADGATLLRYLREFVVAVHFRKEAELLGPAAAMYGDEATAALVGELMRLQDEATELVHSLVMFWEPEGDLTAPEREGFAGTVDQLALRMERMQQIEETELFVTCDRVVPLDDHLGWLRDFTTLENERGSCATWAPLIHALAARWLD